MKKPLPLAVIQTVLCGIWWLCGCGQTAGERVALPVFVQGTAKAPFSVGAWTVELEAAQVALGPMYFCATASASSDLCPSAVGELTSVVVVDGLDPEPKRWPSDGAASASEPSALEAISGSTIRSAFFDYGIAFFATASRPAALRPMRGNLAGHSAHFSGRAIKGAAEVRFVVDVDVLPQVPGSRAVQGLRTEKMLAHAQAGGPPGTVLTIRIAPSRLFGQVDFDQLAALGPQVTLEPDSQMANAIATALIGQAPPELTWTASP